MRNLSEKNIRKITKMGGRGKTMGITLPIEILKELGWRERQKVIVILKGKTISIRDWKK